MKQPSMAAFEVLNSAVVASNDWIKLGQQGSGTKYTIITVLTLDTIGLLALRRDKKSK